MEKILCKIVTVIDGEEIHVGYVRVFFPPRVGEYIRFTHQRKGHFSWIVEDVVHRVGKGDYKSDSLDYQSIVIHAKPTNAL